MLDGRFGSRLAGSKDCGGTGLLTSRTALPECDPVAGGPMNTDVLPDNTIPLSPRPILGGTDCKMCACGPEVDGIVQSREP